MNHVDYVEQGGRRFGEEEVMHTTLSHDQESPGDRKCRSGARAAAAEAAKEVGEESLGPTWVTGWRSLVEDIPHPRHVTLSCCAGFGPIVGAMFALWSLMLFRRNRYRYRQGFYFNGVVLSKTESKHFINKIKLLQSILQNQSLCNYVL